MTDLHASRGPSSSSRWMNCTASPELIDKLKLPPEEDSLPSREGTFCHKVMELRALQTLENVQESDPARIRHLSEELGLNVEFDTKQMSSDLDQLFDYLHWINETKPNAKIWIEQTVRLIHLDGTVWGTADIVIYDAETGYLEVIDLKYGRIFVDEVNNSQATIYLLGAMMSLLKLHQMPVTMRTTIYQPRATGQSLRSSNVTPEYIKNFIDVLREALGPGKQLTTGMWCEYCPALEYCPKMAEKMEALAAEAFSPLGLTMEHAGELIKIKKPIMNLLEKAENLIYTTLETGAEVPGWKLIEGVSQRKWALDEAETVEFLKKTCKMKVSEIYTKKLTGIPAVEKKIKNSKSLDTEILQPYISKPVGRPKLVKDTDSRPAIVVNTFKSLED